MLGNKNCVHEDDQHQLPHVHLFRPDRLSILNKLGRAIIIGLDDDKSDFAVAHPVGAISYHAFAVEFDDCAFVVDPYG